MLAVIDTVELVVGGSFLLLIFAIAVVVYFTHDDKKNFRDAARDARKDVEKIHEEIRRVIREDK